MLKFINYPFELINPFKNYSMISFHERFSRFGQKSVDSIEINGVKWSTENLNHTGDGAYFHKNDLYFAHVFGCAYPYEVLTSILPHGTKIPSQYDWQLLIDSYQGCIFSLGVRGQSELQLQTVGFYIAANNITSTKLAVYWTSTISGNDQVVIFFDFQNSKYHFEAFPRDYAFAARLIVI